MLWLNPKTSLVIILYMYKNNCKNVLSQVEHN